MVKLTKLAKNKNILIGAVIFVFLLGALSVWYASFQKQVAQQSAPITQNQILIQRGKDTVIINDNGVVEYRLESGTYFDTWDLDRVNTFFTSLQDKARKLKNQTPPPVGTNYYTVTLYVDGQLVTIYVDEGDEVVDQVFTGGPGGGTGGFNFDLGSGSSSGGSSSPTPTPTPLPTNPGTVSAGGGSSGSGGGGSTTQDVFNCNLNSQTVANKTIISNTLCQVEQPQE